MTYNEIAKKYEEFKKKYIGKYVDFDHQYGPQCLDLAQQYVTEEFGISWEILATGWAGNLNNEPKYSQMLTTFDEVPTNQMIKGDIVVWSNTLGGHIAIFDSWDGVNCLYLTQNDGTGENPSGATRCGTLNIQGIAKAYRLKGAKPDMIIKLRGHIQDIGWTNWQNNVCGTTGQNKRLEALQIDAPFKIRAKAHIQDIGWKDYGEITKDTVIGTTGQAKRLEALELDGEGFKFKLHVQDLGWSPYMCCNSQIGTMGFGKQIEAIEIREKD